MPGPVAAPSAVELVDALAEPHRLVVISALVLGAGTVGEYETRPISRPAMPRPRCTGANARAVLVDGELITLHAEVFTSAAREAAGTGSVEFAGQPDAPVLYAFLRRGELPDTPADQRCRKIVLRYAERNVDQVRVLAPRRFAAIRSISALCSERLAANTG